MPDSPWLVFTRTASIWPKVILAGLLLGLVVAVAWIDSLTGVELSVSSLYLVPVAVGTWVVGRSMGNVIALASVGAWIVADSLKEHTYSHWLFPAWNAWMLAISFLVVVALLASLREANEDLEQAVSRRTKALQMENTQSKQAGRELPHALGEVQATRPKLQRTQFQLIEAAKMESVVRLANGVVHDVKNPLVTFLAKPVIIDELKQTLAEHIRG